MDEESVNGRIELQEYLANSTRIMHWSLHCGKQWDFCYIQEEFCKRILNEYNSPIFRILFIQRGSSEMPIIL